MMSENRFRLADLTRDEFAEAMKEGRWLLLPFGSVEQHGPHLPLGTDLFYAEHVCLAVAERVNGLVAPGLLIGGSIRDWGWSARGSDSPPQTNTGQPRRNPRVLRRQEESACGATRDSR